VGGRCVGRAVDQDHLEARCRLLRGEAVDRGADRGGGRVGGDHERKPGVEGPRRAQERRPGAVPGPPPGGGKGRGVGGTGPRPKVPRPTSENSTRNEVSLGLTRSSKAKSTTQQSHDEMMRMPIVLSRKRPTFASKRPW